MRLDWKHLFDWTVVSAKEPVAVKNKHGAIEGYQVEVKYMYHGTRNLFFDIDSTFWYAQYGSPLEAARTMYRQYDAQAKEWQRKASQMIRK